MPSYTCNEHNTYDGYGDITDRMARKLAHKHGTSNGPDDGSGPWRGVAAIDRRRYLGLASAAVAAIASVSGRVASRQPPQRGLLIRGNGELSKYEFTVGGTLDAGIDSGEDAGERISGSSAEGVVKDADRRYRFSGEIRDFAITGDATIYLRSGSERHELSVNERGGTSKIE